MGDSENITTGMYIFLLLLLLFCSWWIHAILDSIYLHYDPLYPSSLEVSTTVQQCGQLVGSSLRGCLFIASYHFFISFGKFKN
jgi:hypothetical protein